MEVSTLINDFNNENISVQQLTYYNIGKKTTIPNIITFIDNDIEFYIQIDLYSDLIVLYTLANYIDDSKFSFMSLKNPLDWNSSDTLGARRALLDKENNYYLYNNNTIKQYLYNQKFIKNNKVLGIPFTYTNIIEIKENCLKLSSLLKLLITQSKVNYNFKNLTEVYELEPKPYGILYEKASDYFKDCSYHKGYFVYTCRNGYLLSEINIRDDTVITWESERVKAYKYITNDSLKNYLMRHNLLVYSHINEPINEFIRISYESYRQKDIDLLSKSWCEFILRTGIYSLNRIQFHNFTKRKNLWSKKIEYDGKVQILSPIFEISNKPKEVLELDLSFNTQLQNRFTIRFVTNEYQQSDILNQKYPYSTIAILRILILDALLYHSKNNNQRHTFKKYLSLLVDINNISELHDIPKPLQKLKNQINNTQSVNEILCHYNDWVRDMEEIV